ncbi:MAG: acyloxyacyl hydrolase [Flavobacteriaceae bacterium]
MKIKFSFLIIVIAFKVFGQERPHTLKYSYFMAPEVLFGILSEPNTDFPEVGFQKTVYLTFGKYQDNNQQEWASRLNYPKTGFSLGFSDYGNSEQVGKSYSLLPYAEFRLFDSQKLNALFGLGASYHDVQYDIRENPNNKAVSTKFSWAFRGSLTYDWWYFEKSMLRLSLNYLHHSNGHVRLPNQGMNSFLLGVSYETGVFRSMDSGKQDKVIPEFSRSTYNFLDLRFGLGQNVLSEIYNDKKEVYAIALSYGKVINKTYSFGGGIYYRFYEHYYQYIKNDEMLVKEDYPELRDHPVLNASAFGIFGTGELLLNHIGIEFQLGINIYKPAYKIDWRLNQGYVFIAYDDEDEPYIAVKLGELDSYYKIKKTISSRLGLKYYIIPTDETPVHNFYIGAHLNANLGQADFGELSIGYTYNFNLKGSN